MQDPEIFHEPTVVGRSVDAAPAGVEHRPEVDGRLAAAFLSAPVTSSVRM